MSSQTARRWMLNDVLCVTRTGAAGARRAHQEMDGGIAGLFAHNN